MNERPIHEELSRAAIGEEGNTLTMRLHVTSRISFDQQFYRKAVNVQTFVV